MNANVSRLFQGTEISVEYVHKELTLISLIQKQSWGKGNPSALWKCKLVQPLWKTVWRFLRKLKIELPYDPAIPLLGIYPDKTIIQKDTCTPVFIAALFTIDKT